MSVFKATTLLFLFLFLLCACTSNTPTGGQTTTASLTSPASEEWVMFSRMDDGLVPWSEYRIEMYGHLTGHEQARLVDEFRGHQEAMQEIVNEATILEVGFSQPHDVVVTIEVPDEVSVVGTYRFDAAAGVLRLVDVSRPQNGRMSANLPPWAVGSPLLFLDGGALEVFEPVITRVSPNSRIGRVDSVMFYADAQ